MSRFIVKVGYAFGSKEKHFRSPVSASAYAVQALCSNSNQVSIRRAGVQYDLYQMDGWDGSSMYYLHCPKSDRDKWLGDGLHWKNVPIVIDRLAKVETC